MLARRRLRRYEHLGLRLTAQSAVGKAVLLLAAPALRRRQAPGLRDLTALGDPSLTGEGFVRALLADGKTEPQLHMLLAEYAEVEAALQERYAISGVLRPQNWAVGQQSALALYMLVRLLRPRVMVESGVANGHSTFVILSALRRSGEGALVSLDVDHEVGALVPADLRDAWQLVLLDATDPISDAAAQLTNHDAVDIFFHDGDHSFAGQLSDYRLARKLLSSSSRGLLLSDDIDESFAFLDFVHEHRLVTATLFDGSKMLGGCWVADSGSSPPVLRH